MYAITFHFDHQELRANLQANCADADFLSPIKQVLEKHGFVSHFGNVYIGDERVDAVTCVLAAIDLSNTLRWFAPSVRDIRMLRIEEINDLMPAVHQKHPSEARRPSTGSLPAWQPDWP